MSKPESKAAQSSLIVTDLFKSFIEGSGQELKILQGVTLQMNPGESLAILGRSGSGKSTLLHLIAGLDQPNQGRVLFEGAEVQSLSKEETSEYRNKKVGLVFQAHHLLPDFTALENVMIPALIGGVNQGQAKQKAMSLLNEVGLAERAEHKPAELSGGEQQRVAIARALIMDPKLLLCDEPTGNLDRDNEKKVTDLIVSIAKERGAILIMVTHNPELAKRLGRQMTLNGGHLTTAEDSAATTTT